MPWYDEAVFYHIYPLGLLGAPRENPYGEPVHRLPALVPWLDHLVDLGVTALYIGPLFQSVGHGYETTDYRTVDSRLGDNDDLRDLVKAAHERGIRVILDGVFNHVGRDFFAFRDLKENREASPYRDWFCNVNFWGNNSYNDGFSYDTWGGYDLLVKLNQRNPAVRDYLLDNVRFWVDEFDIDGIRLDAADVLDFDFMHALRAVANEVKPDFWLMGEVIHGEYSRWVNGDTLHAVTNYSLHKALYSGHNDHNYFEIAHTVKRNYDMGGGRVDGLRLYNFVDNHDVDRIWTKLADKRHFAPVHVLMYTLPGTPSIYYGSEFAIEGKRTNYADDMLRPALDLADFADSAAADFLATLGRVRGRVPALSHGEYRELALTNRQYAFGRVLGPGTSAIVTVNNDDNPATMTVDCLGAEAYKGALGGQVVVAHDGVVDLPVGGCAGEIWCPGAADGSCDAAIDDACEAVAALEAQAREAEESAAEEGGDADLMERVLDAVARATGAEVGEGATDDVAAADAEAADAPAAAADDAPGEVAAVTEAVEAVADSVSANGAMVVAPVAAPAPADAAPEAPSDSVAAKPANAGEAPVEAGTASDAPDADSASANAAKPANAGDTDAPAAAGADAEDSDDGAVGSSDGDADTPGPADLDLDFLLGRKKPFEDMSMRELQLSILAQMAMRGPVTERMRQDVIENVYHDSLVNWAKSFN